ncbi:MAG: glycosyltransferase family 2 protein [Oscillospiraceae bacterium]
MQNYSVALAAYNGEKFIKKQLQSILNQTVKPTEVIITDDCSTDKTPQIVEEFIGVSGLTDWKLYRSDKNVGYRRNFYNAIERTSAEIIFLCDQDDVWQPQKAEKMLDLFQSNPQALAVNSSFKFINQDDEDISFNKRDGKSNNNLIHQRIAEKEFVRISVNDIVRYNISPGCTMAIRRKVAMRYLSKTNCAMPHDWELNILAAEMDGLYFYNSPLINYRIHQNNTIGMKMQNETIELKMRGSEETRKDVLYTQTAQADIALSVGDKLDKKTVKFAAHLKSFCDNRQKIIYEKKFLPCIKNFWHYLFLRRVETVHFRGLLGDIVYIGVNIFKRGGDKTNA